MKKLFTTLLLAASATLAVPATAGTLNGEVRIADPRGGARADSNEFRVEAWDKVLGLNVGAELEARQPENEGKVTSKASIKTGLSLPAFAGFNTALVAEVGQNFGEAVAGGNFSFWGGAVNVSRPVVAGLTAHAGYRHREGFTSGNLKEDRVHGGLSYALTQKDDVGVLYYRTRSGGNDFDAVGISFTRKF